VHLQKIASTRLANQQIAGSAFTKVNELIRHMGAIQAQDYAMAKWAIGKRLPHATDDSVEAAIAKGEILRIHLLRPTWHLVAADDIHWLLALTAPNIAASMRSRHNDLGLTMPVIMKCNRIIEKALATRGALTRDEIAHLLMNKGIPTTDNNRLSHILLCAELEGLVCSGPRRGTALTYALLAERVPVRATLTREEALAETARRYFTSRGPATIGDFVWWSGLHVGEAKRAVELVRRSLTSEVVGPSTYWCGDSDVHTKDGGRGVHLLPAFDEYLIAYKDRSAVLPKAHQQRTVSSNGIFRPIVVVDGEVAGLWRRTTVNRDLIVQVDLFNKKAVPRAMRAIERECKMLAGYLGRDVEVIWGSPRSK
jgi:hypothetical protein